MEWETILTGFDPFSQALMVVPDFFTLFRESGMLNLFVIGVFENLYFYAVIMWVAFVIMIPAAFFVVFWKYLWDKLITSFSHY